MSDKTYNGWTNYETWCVKLWIDNEQSSHEYCAEHAETLYQQNLQAFIDQNTKSGEDDYTPTKEDKEQAAEDAAGQLASLLKDEMEEACPDLGASVWADLLGAALCEVNWHEMATSMIEDVDK